MLSASTLSYTGHKGLERLPIVSITPLSLQDFPERLAAILWMMGCNMRCVYCHNPDLVLGRKAKLPWAEVAQFLQKRRGQLDGIVLSGGECTLSPQIQELLEYLRQCGYQVKLDTNGLKPEVLKVLVEKGLVDYVALDYKSPEPLFEKVAQRGSFRRFSESLDFLCASGLEFEVRTTVPVGLMSEQDINAIAHDLHRRGYQGKYYLQKVQRQIPTLGELPLQNRWIDMSQLNQFEGVELVERGKK